MLAFTRGCDERAVHVDAGLGKEVSRLLLPDADAHVVEDLLQRVDGTHVKPTAEIGSRGGVRNALSAEGVQESGIVAA